MEKYLTSAKSSHKKLSLSIIIIGLLIRLLLPLFGHNFDFDSYWLVGEIVNQHQNVYIGTIRYNYGPIWFFIIFLFKNIAKLSPDSEVLIFRWLIVAILTFTDIAIYTTLYRKFNLATAALYYLNPIVMIISGYHNQFDNLAILLAIQACIILDRQRDLSQNKGFLAGLFLLGISITLKHVYIFFPIWMFIKLIFQKEWGKAFLSGLIPLSVFFGSFVPFSFNGGIDSIIQNVFLYRSFQNGPFFYLLVPDVLRSISNPMVWMIALLFIVGILFQKSDYFELAIIYLAALVTFSPALANQYLAIPGVFIACFPNIYLVIYIFLGTVHLLISPDGLQLQLNHWFSSNNNIFIYYAYFALLIGLLAFFIKRLYWASPIAKGPRAKRSVE